MSTTEADPEAGGAEAARTPRRSRTSGIDRALQILDHLQREGRPATANEIARAVGAPLSTIDVSVDDLVDKLTRVLTAAPEEYERMQQASLDGVAVHDINRTLDTFEALSRDEPLPE